MNSIAYLLREAREETEKTPYDIAHAAAITETLYMQYESGKKKPDVDILDKIGKFLGKDIAYFLNNGGKPICIDAEQLFSQGRRIRAARLYCGMDAATAARELNIPTTRYDDIEHGYVPMREELDRIAALYRLNPCYLINGADSLDITCAECQGRHMCQGTP